MALVVFGIALVVVGLVLTFTVVGAIIGVPLMGVGAILVLAGARKRTIVHVTHSDAPYGDVSRTHENQTKQER